MQFPYQCEKCGRQFDGSYPIGQAPRVAACPHCGQEGAKRVYAGMSMSVSVRGGSSGYTFGERMKQRNVEAGKRMKGRKPPMNLAALDYGNGDIREVKSG